MNYIIRALLNIHYLQCWLLSSVVPIRKFFSLYYKNAPQVVEQHKLKSTSSRIVKKFDSNSCIPPTILESIWGIILIFEYFYLLSPC